MSEENTVKIDFSLLRAEKAEAALNRVFALLEVWEECGCSSCFDKAAELRETLKEEQE